MTEIVASESKEFMLDTMKKTEELVVVAKQVQSFMEPKEKKITFNGQRYPEYEDWQYAAGLFNFTVKTSDASSIQIEGENGIVRGFTARAQVVDKLTGVIIGSADAICMRDEPNWKAKPSFQLASMAQTRAGSKALSNILRPVMRMAGYMTTPAEEMEGTHGKSITQPKAIPSPTSESNHDTVGSGVSAPTGSPSPSPKPGGISEKQQKLIFAKCQAAQIPHEVFKAFLRDNYSLEHTSEIHWKQMDKILQWIDRYQAVSEDE